MHPPPAFVPPVIEMTRSFGAVKGAVKRGPPSHADEFLHAKGAMEPGCQKLLLGVCGIQKETIKEENNNKVSFQKKKAGKKPEEREEIKCRGKCMIRLILFSTFPIVDIRI